MVKPISLGAIFSYLSLIRSATAIPTQLTHAGPLDNSTDLITRGNTPEKNCMYQVARIQTRCAELRQQVRTIYAQVHGSQVELPEDLQCPQISGSVGGSPHHARRAEDPNMPLVVCRNAETRIKMVVEGLEGMLDSLLVQKRSEESHQPGVPSEPEKGLQRRKNSSQRRQLELIVGTVERNIGPARIEHQGLQRLLAECHSDFQSSTAGTDQISRNNSPANGSVHDTSTMNDPLANETETFGDFDQTEEAPSHLEARDDVVTELMDRLNQAEGELETTNENIRQTYLQVKKCYEDAAKISGTQSRSETKSDHEQGADVHNEDRGARASSSETHTPSTENLLLKRNKNQDALIDRLGRESGYWLQVYDTEVGYTRDARRAHLDLLRAQVGKGQQDRDTQTRIIGIESEKDQCLISESQYRTNATMTTMNLDEVKANLLTCAKKLENTEDAKDNATVNAATNGAHYADCSKYLDKQETAYSTLEAENKRIQGELTKMTQERDDRVDDLKKANGDLQLERKTSTALLLDNSNQNVTITGLLSENRDFKKRVAHLEKLQEHVQCRDIHVDQALQQPELCWWNTARLLPGKTAE
ncbi:hypothetical protein PRZ48_005812 [Zasmidium cellare]|uniref:Uncharacterized protein n=1 Tax=Zasmidium cellare TaxID=395010 RepID=A0ABR0ELL2_ZASCE|nr:hypothetical protein PRZ48_005812 [Zasmidium cellare]